MTNKKNKNIKTSVNRHALKLERLNVVFDRIKEMAAEDEDDCNILLNAFDKMLSDLNCDDFFGTEGQSDPRGDFRNGEWSMFNVEGVDD
jgi:hypothetical protein